MWKSTQNTFSTFLEKKKKKEKNHDICLDWHWPNGLPTSARHWSVHFHQLRVLHTSPPFLPHTHICGYISDLPLILYFYTRGGHTIWYFQFPKMGNCRRPRRIKHACDSDTFHVMTLLWNNLDIAFLCHKQNLTTDLFTGLCVYVCLRKWRDLKKNSYSQ